ncbi:tubulin polyglutamylase complex subunit 2 [Apis mellifera]|uniref:Tubulin polyglutamylase complex subunit 2 n=1 Tax=Apis mellifera TaxID=7460 RepID=A0A7M7L4U0_APIME|nr:tubulin polyglutamylase complex subunit 2 [Apis mellifera]XP_026295149.1 tubulin polyglutamylase complex subunit 2 [Apis mellifera]XP_026295150.1 tubulin polyglutamylase complex subunit 2 [Apis mellifera]|eukprot:XP_006559778.1 tubulin polyglutamylase complex subunit 2 [Apis mellifera]
MSFFVDIVTEDSFYENLTLGVVKILESFPYVKNVRVDRRNGCETTVINSWEQRHCCILPEDVKNFYASIDGFLLQWNLEIAGEEFPIGCMEIGTFSSLKRYTNNSKNYQTDATKKESYNDIHKLENETVCGSSTDLENTISSHLQENDCKMFEIARCFPESEIAKIYLVYRIKPEMESPTIWLHRENTNKWYRLADNFTIYFRMMLVHLGLPLWQCCVAGLSLPAWIQQVYFLIGPHLLPSTVEPMETISTSMWNNGPTNIIDPAIFKGREGKQKSSKKK